MVGTWSTCASAVHSGACDFFGQLFGDSTHRLAISAVARGLTWRRVGVSEVPPSLLRFFDVLNPFTTFVFPNSIVII